MLGIGLGAFTTGFKGGYGLGREIRADQKQARDEQAREQINAEAKAGFDKEVAAGARKPEDFGAFWTEYALPRRVNQLLVDGDVAGAKALQEWGRSEDAIKGGKLFSSALLKAQTGDPAGALADAIAAGKIGGYIANGYEVLGQEEIKDQQGNLVGFRLKLKDPNGKEAEQDIAVGDVGKVISTFVNPDAAYQSQVTARGAQTERQQKRDDFLFEETTKADLARGKGGPTRKDAMEALTKAYPAVEAYPYTNIAADPGFLGWPEDKQNAEIEKWLRQATGTTAAGGPGQGTPQSASPPANKKVVVDTNTGQIIAPGLGSAAQPQNNTAAAQPGLGAAGAAARVKTKQAVAAPVVQFDEYGNPNTAELIEALPLQPDTRPTFRPAVPGQGSRQLAVEEAAQLMQQGGNYPDIAKRLLDAGVPQGEWPAGLRISP